MLIPILIYLQVWGYNTTPLDRQPLSMQVKNYSPYSSWDLNIVANAYLIKYKLETKLIPLFYCLVLCV